MLPTKLQLEIVTPEKMILSEAVDEVILPGREGYLGVLPGHAPLLTSLAIGRVEYKQGGESRSIALAWGFAEILPEKVTILADLAESGENIDVERARAQRAEIESRMKEAGADFDFAKAQASLQKAIVRIEAAELEMRRRPGEVGRKESRRPGSPRTDIGE